MAYASHSRSGLNALQLEISAALYHGMQRLEEYRVYRKTVAELSSLSAHDLRDLGLHRSEIRRAAHSAVYGNDA